MCAGCGQKYRRPVRRVITGGTQSTIVKDRKYLPTRKPLRRSATQTPQGAVTEQDSNTTDPASETEEKDK